MKKHYEVFCKYGPGWGTGWEFHSKFENFEDAALCCQVLMLEHKLREKDISLRQIQWTQKKWTDSVHWDESPPDGPVFHSDNGQIVCGDCGAWEGDEHSEWCRVMRWMLDSFVDKPDSEKPPIPITKQFFDEQRHLMGNPKKKYYVTQDMWSGTPIEATFIDGKCPECSRGFYDSPGECFWCNSKG
jgi:hypothetical protein